MQLPFRFGARSRRVDPRRIFRYPLTPCPKIGVIGDGLHLPSACRRISAQHELVAMRAVTIAAPSDRLLNWEPTGNWTPSMPLIAFTGANYGFLDLEKRDRLWRRFQVPIFEQMLDDEGRRFAFECEAHAGLHIEDGIQHAFSDDELLLDGRPTGMTATLVNGMCGCGKSGVRLFDIQAMGRVEEARI